MIDHSNGADGLGHGLDPEILSRMAMSHYGLWASPTSAPWQQEILIELGQRALSDFQLTTRSKGLQQGYRESVYPTAAFQGFYWQTPTEVSFAYLDFYNSNHQRPCIRYWSTLNPLKKRDYQRLMAWLCQTYAPWPMPDVYINLHPNVLEQNPHLNASRSKHYQALRDWLFTAKASCSGAERVIATAPPLVNIRLEPVPAHRVFNQYKLAYECYQKKTPETDLVPCDYQDLLMAESQQLLLQASIDDHRPIGLLILEHSYYWGFLHYLIKDKCLYPGFRQQGLGTQLEAQLYQHLKHHGSADPIMGAIFKTNTASIRCAQHFNRSVWCTETLLPLEVAAAKALD